MLYRHLTESLESYCAKLTITLIASQGAEFVVDSGLADIALDFLDPAHAHIKPATTFVCMGEEICKLSHPASSGYMPISTYIPFWTLQWQMDASSDTRDAMLLFTILRYANNWGPLAKALIERTDKTQAQLAETPLKFKTAIKYKWEPYSPYAFHGSALEFFAQCGSLRYREFHFFMNLAGASLSTDRATALLHAYSTNRCLSGERAGEGLFQRLLKLGADPNGGDYVTTPLQHVVATCDFEGAKMLLDIGADVNGLGDPAGVKKRYGTKLRGLEGKSPLFICYHNRRPRTNQKGHLRREIAHLLLQHGGKSLSRQEDGKVAEEPAAESKLLRPFGDKHDGWFSDHSSEQGGDSSDMDSGESEDGNGGSDDRIDHSGDKVEDT